MTKRKTRSSSATPGLRAARRSLTGRCGRPARGALSAAMSAMQRARGRRLTVMFLRCRVVVLAASGGRGPADELDCQGEEPASLCRWSHRVLMIHAGAATGRLAGHGLGCRCSG